MFLPTTLLNVLGLFLVNYISISYYNCDHKPLSKIKFHKIFKFMEIFSSSNGSHTPFCEHRTQGWTTRKNGNLGDYLPCHWLLSYPVFGEMTASTLVNFLLSTCLLNNIGILWASRTQSPVLIKACSHTRLIKLSNNDWHFCLNYFQCLGSEVLVIIIKRQCLFFCIV